MKPLVSIIVPCYNSALFICEALDSLCSQTYSNIEIIAINDGSTDQTEERILSYKDSRIKYFRQDNSGQCAASNLGVSKATGEYIKFFDADDIMNPEHIENQVNKIGGSKTAIASCAWGRFYNGDPMSAKFIPETVWKDMLPLDWLKASLSQKCDMMGAWLWLIPRELLEKSGGWDERLSLNNDFEFCIRLILKCSEIKFTPGAKVFYRSGLVNALSQTTSHERYNAAFLSTQLGCSYLLSAEDSPKVRLICANRYQEWIYRIYPLYPELRKKMEFQISSLGGSNRRMDGGNIFKLLTHLLGWKAAKRLKNFFYRLGYLRLVKFRF